jgi:phosphoribosylformimino-5-aminoimidazole carboxamide ribotide isomerase
MGTVTIIGVIDLLDGRAVHASGGARAAYKPVTGSVHHPITPGSAVDLARLYVETLGVRELYVADLDAIVHGRRQDDLIADLAAVGVRLWLDAGTDSADSAREALALGASRVVVGLETLPSYEALVSISQGVGGHHVAFSLDLRGGAPVLRDGFPIDPPDAIAARAVRSGVGALIVLDLARVGSGAGPDVETLATVARAAPGVPILAGGGVRHRQDLDALARAGCTGALVATALLSGALSLPATARSDD